MREIVLPEEAGGLPEIRVSCGRRVEWLGGEKEFLRERQEDEARWQRFQQSGKAIEQEPVMAWLDALAAGRDAPGPN